MGARGKGQRLFPRPAMWKAAAVHEASLFRASLTRTVNDLQIHVRPLSTCKVDDTSNADWNCGLKSQAQEVSGSRISAVLDLISENQIEVFRTLLIG